MSDQTWSSNSRTQCDLSRDEEMGQDMLYSSGTTGKPKGIRIPLKHIPVEQSEGLMALVTTLYKTNSDTIYLSPAPLYHAAPLTFNSAFLAAGATSVILEKFDEESALKAIEDFKATNTY